MQRSDSPEAPAVHATPAAPEAPAVPATAPAPDASVAPDAAATPASPKEALGKRRGAGETRLYSFRPRPAPRGHLEPQPSFPHASALSRPSAPSAPRGADLGSKAIKTRFPRFILGALLLLALCGVVNAVLTFALETHGSQSQLMWTDYRQQKDMDTLVAGSSLAQRSIDPRVLDEVDGYSSFNLGTPLQGVEETLVAIRTACAEHKIKRIVLQVGYSVLQDADGPDPGSTFLVQRSRVVSAQDGLATVAWCVFDQGGWTKTTSVNWLLPWVANHCKLNPSAIVRNVRAKVDGTSLEEGSKILSKKFCYVGKGFGADDYVFNVDDAIFRTFANKEAASDDFVPERLRTLEEICAFCRDAGIEVTAVATPLPAYNILDYGSKYFEQKAQLDALFAQYGIDYLDFTLVDPSLFKADDALYADYEHLNLEGAEKFSHVLADVLKRHDAGEDVSGLFLSEQEYWSSLQGIYAADLEGERVGGKVGLSARALCAQGAQVEYQFCVKKGKKKDQRGKVRKTSDTGWKVVRKWGTDATCAVDFAKRGKYTVRVNVRTVGSKKKYEHYREIDIMY